VDLEPLEDSVDLRTVQNLIEKHVEATSSPRGQWILENWGEMIPKFVKIFPHEYKRVLGVPRFVPRPTTHIPQPAERQEATHG
jgi:glutamate synthase domain-containing protein 3